MRANECTQGALATARRQKAQIARRSKVVNKVDDGRLHCRGTRTDGHPCTYRATNVAGFCKRHMPAQGDPKLKEKRRLSAITKKDSNDRALAWFNEANPNLPPCYACNNDSLCVEDREYFGIQYVMCLDKSCLQRYSLADVATCLTKGVPRSWSRLREKYQAKNGVVKEEVGRTIHVSPGPVGTSSRKRPNQEE